MVYEVYAYPFEFVGCQAIAQRNDPDNHKLNRLLIRAGFTSYEIPHIRGRNKSEMVFVITDDLWHQHPICKRYNPDQEYDHGRRKTEVTSTPSTTRSTTEATSSG